VIIQSEDTDTDIDQAFKGRAQEAKALYEKAGFQVLILHLPRFVTDPIPALDFTIAQLPSTSELHILLLAHGIANEKHEFLLQTTSAANDRLISGKKIREVIQSLRQKNPGLEVYCTSLSCYGGSLGNQLADIPGVMVMASSGAQRSTLLWDNTDPVKSILKALSAGQSYESAQETAWQEHFKALTESVSAYAQASGDLDDKDPHLALPRSGALLFLETWCGAQANESWAVEQFCIEPTSVGFKTSTLDALKAGTLQDVQTRNQAHLKQLEDHRATLPCGAASDLEHQKELDALSIKVSKQLFEHLKQRTQDITIAELRKNLVRSWTKDITKVRSGLIQGETEADIQERIDHAEQSVDQQYLEFYRKYALDHIALFEKECLTDDHIPIDKKVKDGASEVACHDFDVWMLGDWETFMPDDSDDVGKEVKMSYSDFKGLVPSNMSLDQAFPKVSGWILEHIQSESKNHPLKLLHSLLMNHFPNVKDYCNVVDASIQEAKDDIACFNRFSASANSEDWIRLIDVLQLGERKLLK